MIIREEREIVQKYLLMKEIINEGLSEDGNSFIIYDGKTGHPTELTKEEARSNYKLVEELRKNEDFISLLKSGLSYDKIKVLSTILGSIAINERDKNYGKTYQEKINFLGITGYTPKENEDINIDEFFQNYGKMKDGDLEASKYVKNIKSKLVQMNQWEEFRKKYSEKFN